MGRVAREVGLYGAVCVHHAYVATTDVLGATPRRSDLPGGEIGSLPSADLTVLVSRLTLSLSKSLVFTLIAATALPLHVSNGSGPGAWDRGPILVGTTCPVSSLRSSTGCSPYSLDPLRGLRPKLDHGPTTTKCLPTYHQGIEHQTNPYRVRDTREGSLTPFFLNPWRRIGMNKGVLLLASMVLAVLLAGRVASVVSGKEAGAAFPP
jgi:hypothetical protein